MDINNNPILTEAKTQDSEFYIPMVCGFMAHAIGVYYGSKHNFSLAALIGAAAGCGIAGVLIGKGVTKIIINK